MATPEPRISRSHALVGAVAPLIAKLPAREQDRVLQKIATAGVRSGNQVELASKLSAILKGLPVSQDAIDSIAARVFGQNQEPHSSVAQPKTSAPQGKGVAPTEKGVKHHEVLARQTAARSTFISGTRVPSIALGRLTLPHAALVKPHMVSQAVLVPGAQQFIQRSILLPGQALQSANAVAAVSVPAINQTTAAGREVRSTHAQVSAIVGDLRARIVDRTPAGKPATTVVKAPLAVAQTHLNGAVIQGILPAVQSLYRATGTLVEASHVNQVLDAVQQAPEGLHQAVVVFLATHGETVTLVQLETYLKQSGLVLDEAGTLPANVAKVKETVSTPVRSDGHRIAGNLSLQTNDVILTHAAQQSNGLANGSPPAGESMVGPAAKTDVGRISQPVIKPLAAPLEATLKAVPVAVAVELHPALIQLSQGRLNTLARVTLVQKILGRIFNLETVVIKEAAKNLFMASRHSSASVRFLVLKFFRELLLKNPELIKASDLNNELFAMVRREEKQPEMKDLKMNALKVILDLASGNGGGNKDQQEQARAFLEEKGTIETVRGLFSKKQTSPMLLVLGLQGIGEIPNASVSDEIFDVAFNRVAGLKDNGVLDALLSLMKRKGIPMDSKYGLELQRKQGVVRFEAAKARVYTRGDSECVGFERAA